MMLMLTNFNMTLCIIIAAIHAWPPLLIQQPGHTLSGFRFFKNKAFDAFIFSYPQNVVATGSMMIMQMM